MGINSYDLLLVGDGSGSKWGQAIGWACVAVEHNSMERQVFHGAMNNGTVSIAEIMAYVAPLCWYAAKVDKSADMRMRHVHIITDSQYVQSTGEGGVFRQKNNLLWAGFFMLSRFGFKLHWHWLPRDDAALNSFTDALSRESRLQFTAADAGQKVKDAGFNCDSSNPWQ